MPENSGIDGRAGELDRAEATATPTLGSVVSRSPNPPASTAAAPLIANAIESLEDLPELAPHLAFHKASASEPPWDLPAHLPSSCFRLSQITANGRDSEG
jgi:hypothetical protein